MITIMKKLTYIVLIACAAVFSSCGTTDVWKDWENEGNMSEERLRPSEVKPVLCSVEYWKMTYQGTTFYFQFNEGGSVTSDTDESILENSVESDYYLDFKGEQTVLLSLTEGGAMKYLTTGNEDTFVITAYSPNEITATGLNNGEAMTLVPSSATEMTANEETKRAIIIAERKAQAAVYIQNGLSNGILRNSSTNQVLAHYSLSYVDENWAVKISSISEGVLTHTVSNITQDANSDETLALNLDNAVTINGTSIGAFYYDYESGELTTSVTNAKIELNTSSTWITSYIGAWKTNIVDNANTSASLAGLMTQIEFDDRSPRNIIICPGTYNGAQFHYVGFETEAASDNLTDRVTLNNTRVNMLFGGYGNDEQTVRSNPTFAAFLSFCFSSEGLWIYGDADGYTYVLSPTTDTWFRMKSN